MTLEGVENLNLNVNITLFAPGSENDSDTPSKMFRGLIESREHDQSITVRLDDGRDSDFLSEGNTIFLFLAHDLGLYIFAAEICRRSSTSPAVVLHCRHPQQVRYFHRRKSVRVNVNIPVSFSSNLNRSSIQEGAITDISGGGIQLETSQEFPLGTILELVYQLEDIGPVFIDGKIVRSQEKEGRFINGVEFLNPDHYTTDLIGRFIVAEQLRQKRLGLQIFKAFIFNATIAVTAPTVFGIIQYKSLDISALQGKKCSGTITEIGVSGLIVEAPLKLPMGSVLEFSAELPKVGYTTIQASVKEVTGHNGRFRICAEYVSNYEKIRDCVLEQLVHEYNLPKV